MNSFTKDELLILLHILQAQKNRKVYISQKKEDIELVSRLIDKLWKEIMKEERIGQ